MRARWAHRCLAFRALDISDYDEVASFAAEIHAGHPSMDVVMNIAGVSAWGTVDRLTHEQWTKMVAINLMGPIHVIESFLPPMVAADRGGHLVNVSSAAGSDRAALACRLQRKQIRPARTVRGAALRPRRHRHRGVGRVPGAVNTPLVNTVEIAAWIGDDPELVGGGVASAATRFRRKKPQTRSWPGSPKIGF